MENKSLLSYFKELNLHADGKEQSFFKAIGYSSQAFDQIRDLEDDFLDRAVFNFKKIIRKKQNGDEISAQSIFMDAILSEEGEKYLRFLEEHVESKFILYYILVLAFSRFEVAMGIHSGFNGCSCGECDCGDDEGK